MYTQVTIDRRTWLRGRPDDSVLLDTQGRMCCLGFICKTEGIPEANLLMRMTPASLKREDKIRVKKLLNNEMLNNQACRDLITINDNPHINDTEREFRLKYFSQYARYELNFVN